MANPPISNPLKDYVSIHSVEPLLTIFDKECRKNMSSSTEYSLYLSDVLAEYIGCEKASIVGQKSTNNFELPGSLLTEDPRHVV